MMNKANQVLVRFGAVPEIAYFNVETDESISRGSSVVIRTSRGEEAGELLQNIEPGMNQISDSDEGESELLVIRQTNNDDEKKISLIKEKSNQEFSVWEKRIQDWKLDLVLIDLESTLDEQSTILYVLNGRGSDCTMLAIKAAASGLGTIQVQPVDENGLIEVAQSGGGGCGSGGGCGTCG